jgi:hypothetical protein
VKDCDPRISVDAVLPNGVKRRVQVYPSTGVASWNMNGRRIRGRLEDGYFIPTDPEDTLAVMAYAPRRHR